MQKSMKMDMCTKKAIPGQRSTDQRNVMSQQLSELRLMLQRHRRIGELSEEISELNKRITFKERRIEEATINRNFRVCDDLASEVSELKAHRRQLSAELATFQKKSKKAAYYSESKKKQSSHSSTDCAGEMHD